MNILFIGDIVGRPGRNAIAEILPNLKKELAIDLTIANGENLAGGLGMTLDTYEEMVKAGIDYFTSGNHIFKKSEFIPYLDDDSIKVIRPLNYPKDVPGRGWATLRVGKKKIMLINIMGQAFFSESFENPYEAVDELLKREKADIIIVDHHAEATSNKMVMGHYLDGRVTAVLGTHTHVPTADAMILPKGTAYITDVGMVGPLHSSIGGDLETFLQASKTQMPFKYKVGKGEVIFCAVHLVVNEKNKAEDIKLIRRNVCD